MTAPAAPNVRTTYPVENWLTEEEIRDIPTAAYWNDREIESNKHWDVSDGDFEKLEDALERKGIFVQWSELLSALERPLIGQGVSLASGTCWLEARLLRDIPDVEHITCVEFSGHRIHQLAPTVLDHYGIDPDRISLVLGSFYDMKLKDGGMDFVILCQAFHHAHNVDRLLQEIKRVLKPGGLVLILGEHFFGTSIRINRTLRHFAKWVLNYRGHRTREPLLPTWTTLFPGDPAGQGDHHYSARNYADFFATHGFAHRHLVTQAYSIQAFVLTLEPTVE